MRSRIVTLMLVVLSVGCIKVVDMDVGDFPQSLVVNCFFTEGEPFEVNVSRLAPYPDLDSRNIGNANVSIFENNSLLGQLQHTADGIYTNPSILPRPGFVYTITAEAAGYPPVTASDSLPGKVKIENCIHSLEAGIDEDGDYYQEVNVSFYDRICTDFYAVQVYIKTNSSIYDEKKGVWKETIVWSPLELFSHDPVLVAEGITKEDYSKYYVFNDILFKNSLYPLKINTYFETNDVLRVVLETGTENYYLYRKRLIKHGSYSPDQPFKPYDPVPLYSNIENGLGIFAGYQRDIYELTIN